MNDCGTIPTRAPAQADASVRPSRALAALAWVAHLGVLAHAFFLPSRLAGVQIAILVVIGALGLAAAAGARPWVRTGLEAPLLIASGAAVLAIGIAAATGLPVADLESATRWKPLLAPLVLVPALLLPVPGESADAPRRRALAAVAAWAVGSIPASLVGIAQATLAVDLLHTVGWRPAQLEPVPFWPGHFAATGFWWAYPQYAHALVPGIALAGALALGARKSARWRAGVGACAALAAVAVALTVSRAAWGSLLVVVLAIALLAEPRVRRVALPALVAAAVIVTVLHPGLRIRLGNTLDPDVNHNRLLFARVCSAMWRDHPLGVGWGRFEPSADPYFDAVFPGYPIRTGCHMTPLTLLVEGGPLLVAAWLVAAALVVRTLARWRRTADATGRAAASGALAALAGFAANGLFHDVHLESHALWPLAFTLAVAAVLARPTEARAPPQPS